MSRIGALALASALSLAAPRAQAQDHLVEARAAFETGLRLLEDTRYAEAVASLDRSLALRESPSVLYNLGLALRGMGSYRRAITVFERFLIVAQQPDALRLDAQSIVSELRESLAVVTLTVRGDATEVLVDAARVASADGTSLLPLDPGAHTVEVQRPGFRAQRRAITLAAGAREAITLDASTEPLPSTLRIDCDDADAEISLNGTAVGRGTYEASVTPGSHSVEVRPRDGEPHRRTLRIAPGTNPRVSFAVLSRPGSVLTRWWFWTAAAALVGALVVGGVVIFSGTQDPVQGTWGTAFGAVLTR